MKSVLILPTGKVMVFTVREVAELYQRNLGGTLVRTIPCEANIERLKETV